VGKVFPYNLPVSQGSLHPLQTDRQTNKRTDGQIDDNHANAHARYFKAQAQTTQKHQMN